MLLRQSVRFLVGDHHPTKQNASGPQVEPSLVIIPQIQITGAHRAACGGGWTEHCEAPPSEGKQPQCAWQDDVFWWEGRSNMFGSQVIEERSLSADKEAACS